MTTAAEAEQIAEKNLAPHLPRRWRHTIGVARAARSLAERIGLQDDDGDLLVAGAWLHDIGYSPDLATSGFHPLDGADHLRALGIEADVASLVAGHTNAEVEAGFHGLGGELTRHLPGSARAQWLLPMLTYCDLTTSVDGDPTDIDGRLADIYDRYSPDDIVHRAITQGEQQLREIHSLVGAQSSRP